MKCTDGHNRSRGGLEMAFLQWKDTQLYYEVHGQGQPMVFLSETACDGEVWKLYQVPEFSRDHRVILHDYRGTGRSGKPSIDYSTKMFCDDVAALLDHLGVEKAIVVGHSMGGRIAQLLGLEYPNKVDKLILASTGAAFPATKGLPLKICQEMIEWGYEKYVRDHSILVGFTDEFAKKYPERVEKYLEVRMSNLCPVEFYLRHLISLQSHNTRLRRNDNRLSTLILVGEDDRNITSPINPRTPSETIAQGTPTSKLVVTSRPRH